jgi:hypothetical protein
MTNLRLIEYAPRWRIALVAHVARLLGVRIHVEGIPFGSNRHQRPEMLDGPCVASSR